MASIFVIFGQGHMIVNIVKNEQNKYIIKLLNGISLSLTVNNWTYLMITQRDSDLPAVFSTVLKQLTTILPRPNAKPH